MECGGEGWDVVSVRVRVEGRERVVLERGV